MADAGTLSDREIEGGEGQIPLERPSLAPIAPGERVASIDVLRGVAVLGILPMNILTGFALLSAAFFNPVADGGFDPANRAVWLATHLIFDMKMMAIFSMLFGAGLIVMSDRADARGSPLAGRYYRRLGWLALLGFLHAYLLWYGDILFIYAICGMLLFPLRRLPAWLLIVIGAGLLPVAMLFGFVMGFGLEYLRDNMPAQWEETLKGFAPTPEQAQAEVDARTGTYPELLAWNFPTAISLHLVMLPLWALWRVTGLMLLGMALLKLGVLSAARSTRFYAMMAAAGYGLGVPLVWTGAMKIEASGFDPIYIFKAGWNYNYVGSVLIALAHIALVMLVYRSGVLGALGRGLGSVGRTALSNYLFQTVLCLTLFSAMGLFSTLDRVQLIGITAAIWVVQVAMSTAWLQAGFRYGPAEWAWRSLTYGRMEPMRRRGAAATG